MARRASLSPWQARTDIATAAARLAGHRVLVLDSDAESFGRIFINLSAVGCPARLARRWAQALDLAATVRPTVVIFSTTWEKDAATLLLTLQESPTTRQALLVALADTLSKHERRRLLALGCHGYLWKPTDRYLFAIDLVRFTPPLLPPPSTAAGLPSSPHAGWLGAPRS